MTGDCRAQGSRNAARAVYCKPTVAQVLAATRSLYQDELRPFGRILLKRIRERAARSAAEAAGLPAPAVPDVSDVPLIDPRCLRRVCEGCSVFQVLPAEGKEYSVTLAGHTGVFVDPCSARDPYPGQMWAEAAAYFDGLSDEDGQFPSGRYACAQVIKARNLPFFRGRSLGEICHIVQLAISQKKILGYSDSHLVPYGRSDECVKESCALRQQPVSSPYEARLPYATWDDVIRGMQIVLESSTNPGPGMVTLSNVKRLFRAHLGMELSETVLGHARVGELLQDPRLSHVCTLHSVGNGQAIVQSVAATWGMYAGAMPHGQQAMFASFVAPIDDAAELSTDAGHCLRWSSCASNRQPVVQQYAVVPVLLPAGDETSADLLQAWPGTVLCCIQSAMPATGDEAANPGLVRGDAETDEKAQARDDEADTGSLRSSLSGGWASSGTGTTSLASSQRLSDCEAAEEPNSPTAAHKSQLVVRNTFIDVSGQAAAAAAANRRASSVPRSGR